ncbi:MAG: hypothetical protein IJU01_00505 [Lachnospiraceae bacterium]|nr:hypothetical protein [Lachnospiraceae bacterium]
MAENNGINIAKAYVQIIPTTKGIGKSIAAGINSEAGSVGSSSGKKVGNALVKGIGKALAVGSAALTAGAVAVGKIVSESVRAYADYEQLVGGIETMFGARGAKSVEEYADLVGQSVDQVADKYASLKAAEADMMANAANAWKTAGLSANDYMELSTSFAAALVSSLDGDTEKAAKAADKAIGDMSDNANKMGADISSIQSAYQGFAKQNYTMLDNLKLGYGGTKTEMERLLKDAEAISGVKFDISSYADVVEAIHVIQDNMGITGTTAREAASTISGSLSSMKTSWSNVLVGIADDTSDFDSLINNLVESISTFGENIMPRIEIAIDGVAKLVEKLAPKIAEKLPGMVTKLLPSLIDAATSLVVGLAESFPQLVPALLDGAQAMIAGLIKSFPKILKSLASALKSALTGIFKKIGAEVKLDSLFKSFENVGAFIKKTLQQAAKLIKPAVGILTSVSNAIVSVLEKITASRETMNVILGVAGAAVTLVGAFKAFVAIRGIVVGAINAITAAMDTNPIFLAISAVALLAGAFIGLASAAAESREEQLEQQYGLKGATRELVDAINEEAEAWREARSAMAEHAKDVEDENTLTQGLWKELRNIVDENGKIKKGYEDRAQVITGALAEALGIEIEIVDNQIVKYDELSQKLDEVIAKKRLSTLVDLGEERYAEAYAGQASAYDEWIAAALKVQEKQKEVNALWDEWERLQTIAEETRYTPDLLDSAAAGTAYLTAKNALDELVSAEDKAAAKYSEYTEFVTGYENALAASVSGSVDEIVSAADSFSNTIFRTEEDWVLVGRRAGKGLVDSLQQAITDGKTDVETATHQVMDALRAGVISPEDFEKFITESAVGIPDGIVSQEDSVESAIDNLMQAVKDGFITQDQAKTWAEDMMFGFQYGVKNMDDSVIKTVQDFADEIKKRLHFSVPDVGPLADADEWMPDFMDLLAGGIRANSGKVIGEVSALGFDINETMAALADDQTLGADLSLSMSASSSMMQTAEAADKGSLLASISRKLDNLKIYLDSGALVGGVKTKIDEALGSNSILAGRGVAY